MTIGAIVQARMSSTRLPGKVLLPLASKPVLWHVLSRLKRSKRIDTVVLATSTCPEDKQLQAVADQLEVPVFYGDLNDVLSRYYHAAVKYRIDTIVRVTADCPMIDPWVTDEVIEAFFKDAYDYYFLGGAFPDGLDTQVFKFSAIEKAFYETKLPSQREHVGGDYFETNTDTFKIGHLEKFRDKSHLRWTIDEPRDYEFLQAVFNELYTAGRVFSHQEVLELLERQPELMEINSKITRNEGYLKSLKEDAKFLAEQEGQS